MSEVIYKATRFPRSQWTDLLKSVWYQGQRLGPPGTRPYWRAAVRKSPTRRQVFDASRFAEDWLLRRYPPGSPVPWDPEEETDLPAVPKGAAMKRVVDQVDLELALQTLESGKGTLRDVVAAGLDLEKVLDAWFFVFFAECNEAGFFPYGELPR